jgi:hypothetical protein
MRRRRPRGPGPPCRHQRRKRGSLSDPNRTGRPFVGDAVALRDGASALPDVAKRHSPEGAEEYVRHWVAAANEAFGTGEVQQWRQLSEPSCKSCNARMDDVEKAYGAAGRIEGGLLQIKNVVATPLRPDSVPLVSVDAVASPESRFDRSGKILSKDAGGRVKLVFFLRWHDSSWSVAEIKVGVQK